MTPELQQIVSATYKNGCEVTLSQLISALDAQGMLLDQLDSVTNFVNEWKFCISPPLNTGDMNTPRVLRQSIFSQHTSDTVLSELNHGENSLNEFKSSLLFDHKRAIADPLTPIAKLRSDAVLFSTLKTIAAFMNSGGGVLFVGVTDESIPIGLTEDCRILNCNGFDADKWQLELRNQVTGKFKDGSPANDYIEIHCIEVSSHYIARIQVLSRRRLTFIGKNGDYHLYRRQGNRTMEVVIDEIEDFLDLRRQQRQQPY